MRHWPSRLRGRSEWTRTGIAARLALVALALSVVAVAAISSPLSAAVRTGTPKADVLRGTSGNDVMRGLGGADRLIGYGGNDRLVGGPGADYLLGGAGRDRHEGGQGNDRLVGGPGDDFLLGGAGQDRLEGGPGNDRIDARDGGRDFIFCGGGRDSVLKDARDVVARDCVAVQPPPMPPPMPPPVGNNIILNNEPWRCLGRVNLDLVRVTMRTTVEDALRLDQNCSGRVGRIEVETWTADGIKVQNRGTVAHDLVIESGYVKCHDVYPGYHQDGVQAMGGSRLTFKNLRIDCLRNSNFFLARGGSGASTPTDIICDGCVFGPHSGQTVFYAPSIRSGVRNSTICTGRFRAIRVEPGAEQLVNTNNRTLPRGHASCKDVTGRGASTP